MSERTESQDAALSFLANPATHGGRDVRRIDTHAAAVFLAGDRAFKIKRAVRFPFLDFSTLDKRKAALDAELEVNQAFAPQLYRGVLPIVRDARGDFALGGDGEPIEWALEMCRFDETQTLDHRADAGGVDDAMAAKLADAVAAMHRQAPKADAQAWLAAMASYIDQDTEAFREQPALFAAERVAALERVSRAAFERLHPLLEMRGRLGLIRRGHGDLHLGNIVMLDGEPVPFDALEFDPVVASGDVLYDLAFLLMDLVERGLGGAANIVLNGYLARTRRAEDLDGLAALPLFISLRAAIRAKVIAARLDHAAATDRGRLADVARSYFDLATRAVTPPRPILIAVGGLSGTGKSMLARRLAPFVAPDPGAVLLRSDVERKTLFGVAETEPLPKEAYRAEVSMRIYDELAGKAARVVAAGHSAIVDAVFGKRDERDAIAAVGAAQGMTFCGLFLVTDLATRLARVGGRKGDASDADAAVVRQQESFALGSMDWIEIDASGTPEDTLRRARQALAHKLP